MTMAPREASTLAIPVADVALPGDLSIPPHALGLVVFAHGSGSSRKSSRNRFVAQQLWRRRLGTLLFDLLTRHEEREDELSGGALRFDIEFLAGRLVGASDWLAAQGELRLPIAYFGASTGAAAALVAAARRAHLIKAVVSRGGRPDLAAEYLSRVTAPTLLIVGSDDTDVVALNRQALASLGGSRQLAIVDGATHLFEEPGALEDVSRLAGDWFVQHLDGNA
jgi:putative phosphoribosyl transferase